MKSIKLTDEYIRGAVSLEKNENGIQPWRLPIHRIDLFDSGLVVQASHPAGVRVAFTSNTTQLSLQIAPNENSLELDLVIEGELIEKITQQKGEEICRFQPLPPGVKKVEIYLTQNTSIRLKSLLIDEHATVQPIEDQQPRWITYGSSITQCAIAESPAQTWPAIIARNLGWDLTCLGYSAQCHIEPMIAQMIRDMPADYISLCLGINVYGRGSLSIRTFRSAVIGMISIIREKHQHTPLFIISPIYSNEREWDNNQVELNLVEMRAEIQEAVRLLQAYGDQNLHYIHGLDVMGESHADYIPDGLHPNAEGYKIMAEHLQREMLSKL